MPPEDMHFERTIDRDLQVRWIGVDSAPMTTANEERPPRPRRWIPASLWIFAAILIVLSVWSGVQLYRRHVAIRAIERQSSKFTATKERGPFGIGRWLPAFVEVQYVEFFDRPVADDDLKVFGLVSEVKVLNLENRQVTDAGLEHLGGLRSLQWLRLDGTRVTDAGLAKLANLPYLEVLDLSRTKVTDAGLARLRNLKSMHDLILTDTHVTNAGVTELQRFLPGLKVTR